MLNSFPDNGSLKKESPYWELRGNVNPLSNHSFGLEPELRVDFSRRLSLGFSTSLPEIYKKNDNFLEWIYYPGNGEIWPNFYRYKTEFEASIPFKFTIYYSPEFRWGSKIYLFAGAGIYKGKMSLVYNND